MIPAPETVSAPVSDDFPAQYDPAATEAAIYASWQGAGCFTADASRSARIGGDRDPYGILMPPPNVTAILHVGHGLNNTVQDVLVRWARMKGREALWVPGMDHAGIATQNVVEKQLAAEGLTRDDLGREKFIERTKSFVEQTGGVILQQLRAIGASADWSRSAYTFSPELSAAVRDQSAEAPMERSCWRITPPVCSTKHLVRSMNLSRPRSSRVSPSAASCFSTTFCVAMPA